MKLEVHINLFADGHPFALSLNALKRSARMVSVPGSTSGHSATVPRTDYLLLHVCLHFAWSHMMSEGLWRAVRDVAALAARGGVNWEQFVTLARESRGASCCYWALRLARTFGDAAVPEHVLWQLRPRRRGWSLRRLERHYALTAIPTEAVCPSATLGRAMWRAGIRPERSGHGRARPWARVDEHLRSTVAGGEAATGGSRLALALSRHVRRVRGWGRYLRMLIEVPASP